MGGGGAIVLDERPKAESVSFPVAAIPFSAQAGGRSQGLSYSD